MSRVTSVLIVCALSGILVLAPAAARGDEYSDGMKSLKAGNITEALEFFIAKVTTNPKHQKSVDQIKELLPQVVDLRKHNAKKYEAAGEFDRAEKEYDRLARLDKVLRALVAYDNGVKIEFQSIGVSEDLSKATANAAEQWYQKGVEAMQVPGNSEEAANCFKEARKFDPDYKDAKELSAQALLHDGVALAERRAYKDAVRLLWKIRDFYPDGYQDSEARISEGIDSAKVKVAVMPFDDLTFKSQFGDIGATMSSEIIAATLNSNPVFVDLVTRDYVYSLLKEQDFGVTDRVDAATAPTVGKLVGVGVFLLGKITAVTPFYPRPTEEHGTSEAIVSEGKQRYSIYARWTKHRRIGEVTVSANYQLVDVATGRIVESKTVTRKMSSAAQWVTFEGNEDAIEPAVRAFNTTGDVPVQPAEVLAMDAVRQISREIARSILDGYE